MIEIRKSNERGTANHGWLQAKHSFSFADYYDPEHLGFRDLLVINEDHIAKGSGFATHPHKDMEIVTYVFEGELKHKDSFGNEEVIKKGEMQRMSAGTGIRHSEFNPSQETETKMLQIWIQTEQKDLEPSYEQKDFKDRMSNKPLTLVVSPKGLDDSLKINQQTKFWAGEMVKGEKVEHRLEYDYAWIQVVKGLISVNGKKAEIGDGLALSKEQIVNIESRDESEFILIELR